MVGESKILCQAQYNETPEVNISGDLDLRARCIPAHVRYILLELLKNALRATVEHESAMASAMPVITARKAKVAAANSTFAPVEVS